MLQQCCSYISCESFSQFDLLPLTCCIRLGEQLLALAHCAADDVAELRRGLVLFTRLHHALLALATADDVRRANADVEAFVANAPGRDARMKKATPNLAHLLIKLLLSERGWDAALRDAFLPEALRRNVTWFWTRRGSPPRRWELAKLERDAVSVHRLAATLLASTTSLRLIALQICIVDAIARRAGARSRDDMLRVYHSSLGRPTAGMLDDLLTKVRAAASPLPSLKPRRGGHTSHLPLLRRIMRTPSRRWGGACRVPSLTPTTDLCNTLAPPRRCSFACLCFSFSLLSCLALRPLGLLICPLTSTGT